MRRNERQQRVGVEPGEARDQADELATVNGVTISGHLGDSSRIAAYALVRRDREVLLVRTSASSDAPGQWWLPGGGLEFGEDPADGVLRELYEETGLRGRVTGLLTVLSDVGRRPGHDQRVHSLRLCYTVEVVDGVLSAEVDGSTDLPQWVDASRALDLPLAPFVRTLLSAERSDRQD